MKSRIMKKFIIAGSISMIILFTACQKKTDPVDGNNATVSLVNGGTGYVTDNITVNPKDSIFFSFTINTTKDMRYVGIQKNPVNQVAFITRDTVSSAHLRSYTTEKRLRADSANGDYIYRIVAHDAAGRYIGHKDIIVSVKADFNYYTFRMLQVPDTTAKTNTCYMAATTGTVYSFTNGAANSAQIDFGMYFDTTGTLTPSTTDDLKFCVYALSAAQPQLSYYDISTWTKNATIMKRATSPAFNTLTSAGALRSAGVTNLSSGTSAKIDKLVANNLVFFKTAGGKVGCMLVNFVSGNAPNKETFISVDVKIEK
jgi:hypothetical protein